MTSQRCALVTGATGFIGSHLTRRLVMEGWRVHIFVRPRSNLHLLNNLQGKITLHVLNGYTEQICNIMTTVKPDAVFHLASLFLVQHEIKDVEQLIQSNLCFPTQLLEAMANNGVDRLINTGTSWQHFENRHYSPVNLYAATKQALEAIIQYYVETAGLKVITLKLFDTYGPNDPRLKLVNLLLNTARTEQPLLMSSGEQFIDLVHVDDVISAYITAMELLYDQKFTGHKTFSVKTGQFIKIKDFVELFEKIICKKLDIRWGEKPYRPREVMKPWKEGDLLPGWEPRISLERGISDLLKSCNRGPE